MEAVVKSKARYKIFKEWTREEHRNGKDKKRYKNNAIKKSTGLRALDVSLAQR